MGNCFGRSANIHSHSTPNTSKFISTKPTDSSKFPSKTSLKGDASSTTAAQAPSSGDEVNDPTSSSGGEEGKANAPYLKMFTLTELKKVTRNFRPDSVLGEGGFGTVYKGWVEEKTYAPSRVGVGIPVAVKKSNPESSQGLREWQAEVKFLGKFSHPNLVKLYGYCWEESQFILVYEHVEKGSLENHLFRKGAEPLSWSTRLKIAIGAARGLSFLHNSEKSVIYRDFKTSNILLDREFNAKLSDFGLAKSGPVNGNSHVTTRIMGTYGYAAPEYVATGHLYLKSDVFGFGVVLLELLTGFRALDTTRPSGQHVLVDWAKPSLSHRKKLRKIMDPNLGDQYPLRAAFQVAEIVLMCIESEPRSRPSMDQILDTLTQVNAIPVNGKDKKTTDDPSSSSTSFTSSLKSPHWRSPLRGNGAGPSAQ